MAIFGSDNMVQNGNTLSWSIQHGIPLLPTEVRATEYLNRAKDEVSRINLVSDAITRQTGAPITPCKFIRIEGDRIRIVGDEAVVGVRIVTNFSQGNFLLKELCTIEYRKPLQVGAGGGSGEDDRPVIE